MNKLSLPLLLVLFLGMSTMLTAQDAVKKVPLDPSFRHGKLANGLTYYIRHNEEPKERASFYMVQNVGAMLENDDQNGLAHFLEHMAFNGTKHFPGKGMLNYLQNYGVSFGRNINAYTSMDETVYNLSNVPVKNMNLLDSCLLVLHDWSNDLLLTEEEIDAERGVITEEWRTRRTAQFRLRNMQSSELYKGSKYAVRDVIGDLSIIKNHKYQTLRDFYNKWYRTDLQAIIIVGDFDVDVVEAKVKKLFSPIPAVKNPAKREYVELPNNKGARYVLATDKEATNNVIHLQFKHDIVKAENKGEKYLKSIYYQQMFGSMIAARINERLQKADPPFVFAQAYISSIVRTKSAAGLYILYKNADWKNAFTEACRLVENTRDYGFTAGELERAKINLIRRIEDQYKKRNKRNNDSYAREVKDHYLLNEPVPGIEYELKIVKEQVSKATLKDVNSFAKLYFTDDNILIAVSGPKSKDAVYPTKEQLMDLLKTVKEEKTAAYTDSFKKRALMAKLPKAGKVATTEKIAALDAKVITLSNGIKVYLRQTDLEKEKIILSGHSWGGESLLEDNEIADYMVFNPFIGSFGVADFSDIELKKMLTGKIVRVSPSLGSLKESINGSSSPADMETMFQLVNLYFTQPRFDKTVFNSLQTRYTAFLKNNKNDINSAFRDSISQTMTNHHPRERAFDDVLLQDINFDKLVAIYKKRFDNPGDFTFTISGDFDEKLVIKYLELYIASLPVKQGKETYKDRGVRPPSKDTNNHFEKEMKTAKATVFVNFNNKMKYSEENAIYANVIAKILGKRYLEEIREKQGGTYGVSVYARTNKRPYQSVQYNIKFDCDDNKQEKLKGLVLKEVELMLKGKVLAKDLKEVKENLLKVDTESVAKLSYWHGQLSYYSVNNAAKMSSADYQKFVKSINAKTVVKKAKIFLKKAVKVEIIMTPKKK